MKADSLILETEEQLSALGVQRGNALTFVEQHSLAREMVKKLVKEVHISSATEIEIVWKFQECYSELE